MIYSDYTFGRGETFALVIAMQSPSPIGGYPIAWDMHHRFGGISGLIHKECNSGFNAVSGITITSSGNGIFSVLINAGDTSGFLSKNFASQATRGLSGAVSILHQGFAILTPNING